MNKKSKYLIFVAIGIIFLLFSRLYSGPAQQFFDNYGANISLSFGAYFIFKLFDFPLGKLAQGGIIFLFVSLQEIAQGLQLYPGVFDAWDFLFNAVGILIAILIDTYFVKIGK